ncbi:putative RNA-binding Zn ribbon-like protein [Mycobacterium sp. MAA66]|uniref:ABATE domain-containing protein n=1 Tax=Mycobacterium sp. MAA66 TaxID=3156297 RepID=UPI0035156308
MTVQPTELAPPVLGQALPVELMNTVWGDRYGTYDSLATEAGSGAWLAGLGERLPESITPSAVTRERTRELRDAVRRVAAHVTADPRASAASSGIELKDAIAIINAAAARAPHIPALVNGADGRFLAGSQGDWDDEALLSWLAAATIEFFGSSAADELNACLAPGCLLYFVKDHPRREWCTPACGNRARAARYYARHGRRG